MRCGTLTGFMFIRRCLSWIYGCDLNISTWNRSEDLDFRRVPGGPLHHRDVYGADDWIRTSMICPVSEDTDKSGALLSRATSA